MSMSMMVQKREVTTDISIQNTSPSIWIPSKNIQDCYHDRTSLAYWSYSTWVSTHDRDRE